MVEPKVLGVGVLGLGTQWEQRYRPALLALKALFRIVAVTDQRQQDARREAKLLPCAEAGGLVQMLEHPDIDVLLLADAQWHGLWPVELAAAAGKPLFCGINPGADPEHAERLLAQQSAQLLVLVDLPARVQPALAYLQELCRTKIGPPLRLACTIFGPAANGQAPGELAEGLFSLATLDLCGTLFSEEPVRLWAGGLPDGNLAQLMIEFPGGRGATITRCATRRTRESCRVVVAAEQGTAQAVLPARVQWSGSGGPWSRRWRAAVNPAQELLRRFHTAVLRGEAFTPGLGEAYRAWRWQQWAVRSWHEGKWIECQERNGTRRNTD